MSDRLEQVHKGLGEMQTLAVGVGDLKRVLTNVKTRGTWGEVQLGTLLAEVLTPQQYDANVETVPGSRKRVEFAIRFPGRGDDGAPCWLPVDAKFPLDDWQRLQDALERADVAAADAARKALADFLRLQAKTIHDSYVSPPHTTDFAILFVPTEGLYAEMMSRPGLRRRAAARLSGDAHRPDQLPRAAEQPADGIPHASRSSSARAKCGACWARSRPNSASSGTFSRRPRRSSTRRAIRSTTPAARARPIARKLRDVESIPEIEADRLLTGDDGGRLLDGEQLPAEPDDG